MLQLRLLPSPGSMKRAAAHLISCAFERKSYLQPLTQTRDKCAWLQGYAKLYFLMKARKPSASLVSLQIGVFTMDEGGLNPVENPSALFLSDRTQAKGVSSAVSVTMEGTRPLLVEVQALCTRSHTQVRLWLPLGFRV